MPLHRFTGRCHCGALSLSFATDRPPQDMPVLACQCPFCRKHGVRAVADPHGQVAVAVHDPALLERYRFGLATADFLLCRRCGVYLAAVMTDGDRCYAVVNLNSLDDAGAFTGPPEARIYDDEDEAGRRQRRRTAWTPATVSLSV